MSRRRPNRLLQPHEVAHIKLRLAAGESAAQIARDFLVSAETIRRIKRGETWWDVGEEDTRVREPSPEEISASLARIGQPADAGGVSPPVPFDPSSPPSHLQFDELTQSQHDALERWLGGTGEKV